MTADIEEKCDSIEVNKLVPSYIDKCSAARADGQAILDFAMKAVEEAKAIYGSEYDWVQ